MIAILILDVLGTITYNEIPEPMQRPYNMVSMPDMVSMYGESWRKGRLIQRPNTRPILRGVQRP